MSSKRPTKRIDTLVIGGGQAGLSVGYHLGRRGVPFLILDGSGRVGDAWRRRWDSLRLFTPARFSGLDGMPFPAPPTYFPTKDEMADYLEAYASRFRLPVQCGARVQRLTRENGRFVALTKDARFEADDVVIAMSDDQKPRVPDFADRLDPGIRRLHSAHYRNAGQLREGPVLLVGAGNSGADIAMELAGRHTVWMSGPELGHIPFRLEWRLAQALLVPLVLRVIFHRVLTVRTPLGRKIRPEKLAKGDGLVRVKPKDLERAGVQRVPRVTGTKDGLPVLEDGRVLEPANVIWCTGFEAGFDWIDLPIHGERQPLHESGIVPTQPGLFFVGLRFLHSVSSSMIHGVGRDAERIAGLVAARSAQRGQRAGGASARTVAA
ncbi:MAG TPA: NAD(P)/FAD-dependent oxidoreductase [Longimicrobiales bacterium]|nr:NAD(P)/FAD-dependent oxidoreductase [Longimicrobiales bacterium]